MKKKIKTSKRGLTFSLQEGDGVYVGMKYRYIVDISSKTVNIIPDENGTHVVSKKRTKSSVKPLFDLRSKEVKALINNADFLEIELLDGQIIVSVHKSTAHVRLIKNRTCSVSEVIGRKTGEIILSMEDVRSAVCHLTAVGETVAFSEVNRDNAAKLNQESKNLKKVYDVVSLFSGAGLFDKAWLENGRFRIVYANDFCKDVIDTYVYNIGNHIVCKDIRDVMGGELPSADVFSTSPCCQAFSNANRHNLDDQESKEKRLLVEEVVRLVNEKKPKVVVIENVPGMLTKENGLYLSKVIDGLPDYDVTATIVNDSHCGGYSLRTRAIVIASRIGKIELPDVKVVTTKTVRDALAKVDAEWFNFNDVTCPEEKTRKKMACVPQGGNWRDIPKELNGYGAKTHSNVMRRLAWDEPSITISNFRKSNILHPEENRILSVAEAAAIMGLSKEFRFISDSLSAKQQMVANGVTQAIGRFVRNAVLRKLDNAPCLV